MAFIIIYWGSRQRKMHAFYLFLIYTLVGSLVLLVALFILYAHCHTFEYFTLINMEISSFNQRIL